MRVTRKKEQDRPLAEFPGWGLEIMMGLYGEEQVKTVLSTEAATNRPRTGGAPAPEDARRDVRPEATEAAEFDAVTSVFAKVRRMRRGR